jgi:ankyrin repeat protein
LSWRRTAWWKRTTKEAGMNSTPTAPRIALRVFAAVLLALNLLALAFSALVVSWSLEEPSLEAFLQMLYFGGIGFGIQLLLLLVTLLLVLTSETLARWLRAVTLGAIVLAILLDVVAPVLYCGNEIWHEREYIKKNRMNQSGLRQAVLDGDVQRAKAILEGDPRLLKEKDHHGQGALMLAAKAGDRVMVEMLLGLGADPSSHDYNNVTALQLAVKNNDSETAKMLLDAGGRVNTEDHCGKTALVYARTAGNKAMVELLVGHGGTDADYEAMLVEAVRGGNLEQVKALLDRGLSVNTEVPNGHCLLDYAAEESDIEMARFLISRGASVKRTDRCGRTALHWASGEGNTEMIGFLIDEGADVNAKDFEGMTPLHEAISWSQWHETRSLQALEALAQGGADVNTENNEGTTPLQHAEKYGTHAIRAYLQHCGASY